MNTDVRIPLNTTQIGAFCRGHHIRCMWLFGSVLRDDFGPHSDVDVLVEFEGGFSPTMHDYVEAQSDLAALLRRDVDLVERRAVEASKNYIRRRHILDSIEPIYVAG